MVFNCHCLKCKLSHGAAFATQVIANKQSLTYLKGEKLVKEYHSGGALRAFCSSCGSRLMNYGPEGVNYLSVALTVIKDYKKFKLTGDCYTGRALNFVQLCPNSAKFDKLPPGIS